MTDAIETMDTKSLTRAYGCLTVGLPLAFMPTGPFSALGVVLLLVGVIWAYVLRKRENAPELVTNHARWMIRTFWIGGMFSLIAICLAGVTVSANANNAALDQMAALGQEGAQPDQAQIQALLEQYQTDNASLLLWTTIGYLALPVAFSVARFIKGYRLARQSQPIADVKSWAL